MFVVGITGGIGSGKSAVTDYLETLGVTIVDADKVARLVVAQGTDGLAAITAYFGDDIVLSDGELDRAALRKIVFENPDERKVLEGITHPLIRKEIARQLSEALCGRWRLLWRRTNRLMRGVVRLFELRLCCDCRDE